MCRDGPDASQNFKEIVITFLFSRYLYETFSKYVFFPAQFIFYVAFTVSLKTRSYSIIYEALLCVIFFFVHTDVGQILKIICIWYQSVIIYAEHVNKHKSI